MLSLLSLLIAPAHAGTWAYVTSPQSGKIEVVDLDTGAHVHTIAVEDQSGNVGLAASADGTRLFLVDGDEAHRLRVIDAEDARALTAHGFDNRVKWLGEGTVAHLSADGKQLFVNTFDPSKLGGESSPRGLRVFDVASGTFAGDVTTPSECAAPELMSAVQGALLARCGDVLHPATLANGTLTLGEGTALPFPEVATTTLSADGSVVYLLENVRPDKPWRLAVVGGGQIKVTDLRKTLKDVKDSPMFGSRAFVALSPDGSTLGVVYGQRAWLLDAATLEVRQAVKLKWSVLGASFSADGASLVCVQQGSMATALVRIDVATGKASTAGRFKASDKGLDLLAVAPAP